MYMKSFFLQEFIFIEQGDFKKRSKYYVKKKENYFWLNRTNMFTIRWNIMSIFILIFNLIFSI